MLNFTIALILYYALHSLLAATAVRQQIIRFGLPAPYYRVVYNLIAVTLLLPLAYCYTQADQTLLISFEEPNTSFTFYLTKVAALSMMLLGSILLWRALSSYSLSEFSGRQQLLQQQTAAVQTLNTNGLNAWIRHPLYLAVLIILTGVWLFSPSDLLLSVWIVTAVYVFVGATLEERKLIDEFGEAYRDYQQRVPMIFPYRRPQKS
ncbi:MAG: isoprenylcysteine carboxylmethyltransferase family protein [Bacteroidota bacterium]